jgi:hypothetical protein
MKIEDGKTWRELDLQPGDKVRLVRGGKNTNHQVVCDPYAVGIVGREIVGIKGHGNFTSEYDALFVVLSRADAPPDLSNPLGQVFGLMPLETQEAMEEAYDNGANVDFHCDGAWEECDDPSWNLSIAYRVKPAPIRETVTFHYNRGEFPSTFQTARDTHTITFDLIDGKPDCASIKMEPLE